MPILATQISQAGLADVAPNVAYISTNDTLAQVTTAGYLNILAQSGYQLQEPMMALVSTKTTPTATATAVSWFDVSFSGGNWSLVASSSTSALADSHIFVGNAANVAADVAMSGDITISNTGVTAIGSGVIVNADISASAAIAFSKFAALTSGNILVGSGANVATSVAVSGAITISNTGVTTLGAGAVALSNLAAGITPSHICVFGGTHADGGGSPTVAITVTGALATDLPSVQIAASTNAVEIQKVTATSNTVTVLLSGDPGAATSLTYQVFRAAA